MDTEPKRILIVDDSESNISVLTAALENEFDISVARNGETALRLAAGDGGKPQPDLLMLDVIMPGMDGYEVCRRLKANPATMNIPVIFISSMADEQAETRGLKLGAVDYLVKPFRLPIVKARVHTHVELKRQRDILRELSTVDGLTRIPNRRRFDEYYDIEWLRSKRRQTPLSVIMADIDNFKAYNDTYGHAQGDDCLRAVAQALKNALKRPTDLLARYGGEEFVVVLPETGPKGARHLAEDMRRGVEALGLRHAKSETAPHVTISLGVGTLTPGAMTSPESLVKLADDMLYKAKDGGRNKVES